MKTIRVILLLLLISTAATAQKEIRFVKNLDAYVGTWMYQSNDTVFKIIFQRGTKEGRNTIYPGLYGGYSLSVKGEVIEDYMSPLPSLWDYSVQPQPSNMYIWATNASFQLKDVNLTVLRVIFYDQRKKHFGGTGITGGIIKLLSSDKIHWKLDEERGIWNETEGDDTIGGVNPIGFSVPSDVIMVKVK